MVKSDQSTADAAASARPALINNAQASPTPALTRDARRDAIAAPPAMPTMKIATTVLNAYVVGPRICTSSRVHTTCSVNDANPLVPSAVAASHGCEVRSGGTLVPPLAAAVPLFGLGSASG